MKNFYELQTKYAKIVTTLQNDPASIYEISKNADFIQDIGPMILKKTTQSSDTDERESHEIILENHNELYQFFDESMVSLLIIEPKVIFAMGSFRIANFGAVVLESVINHTIDETFTEINLLVYFENEQPKMLAINSLDLNNSMWISKANAKFWYDDNPKLKAVPKIKRAIQSMLRYAPEKHKYLYNGWLLNIPNSYSYNGTLIDASNLSENTAENCRFVIDKMLETAPHNITFPLISAAILCLVQSKNKTLGEWLRTTFILYGQTQSLKTTLATLFFDFDNGREAHINYESTLAAIKRTMAERRDLPMIADDLKPPFSSTAKLQLIQKTETILRLNGDGSGGYQKAGKKDGTTSFEPQGLTIITAEDIPISVSSSIARSFIIEMNRKTVNKQILTTCQKEHKFYRDFIFGYINYIASIGVDEYCNDLQQRFWENRRALFESAFSDKDTRPDPRTNDTSVLLYLGFENFLNYALELKVIDGIKKNNYLEEMLRILIEHGEQQTARVNDLAEIPKFFNALRYLLDSGEVNILDVTVKDEGNTASESKKAIGFEKNGEIYLKSEAAYQKVKAYCKRNGDDYSISEKTLRKQLNDMELLELREVNRSTGKYLLTVRLKVNKERYSCLVFKKEIFETMTWGGKKNELDKATASEVERYRESKLRAKS